MRRHSIALACVPAGLIAVSACGGAAPASSRSVEHRRAGQEQAASTAPLSPPATRVVRGCDSDHTGVGFGGVSADTLRHSLRAGPLALGGLGTISRSQLPPRRPGQQRFTALESIAIIEAGAVVTVAVPAAQRRSVGLIYDQDKFRPDGQYRVKDLDFVVRFEACKDPAFNHGISQYDGGVVVAGRRCFTLDFYIAGRHAKVRRRIPAHGAC